MDNLNNILNAQEAVTVDMLDHNKAEKWINEKMREFYPSCGLYIVLDEGNPCSNFYAPCQGSHEGSIKLSGERLINIVYSILSDKKLRHFKSTLKLMLDHEARHISSGKEQNEFDAQMYALSRSEDPLDSLSREISIFCYLRGVPPKEGLNRQLEYWGHNSTTNKLYFPLNEKAKAEIVRRAESYTAFLEKTRPDAARADLHLPSNNVISWSKAYP